MVRLILRFGTILTVFAMSTAFAPQVVSASIAPKAGVVEVTGFKGICCNGESGPVVVVAKGPNAVALRRALTGLVPSSTNPLVCVETVNPFVVSVRPRQTAHPTMVATAFSCGGQTVTVKVGKGVTTFTDDCALELAVIAVLPRGRAEGTRQAVSAACPALRRT